jgi:hypothetical protein
MVRTVFHVKGRWRLKVEWLDPSPWLGRVNSEARKPEIPGFLASEFMTPAKAAWVKPLHLSEVWFVEADGNSTV